MKHLVIPPGDPYSIDELNCSISMALRKAGSVVVPASVVAHAWPLDSDEPSARLGRRKAIEAFAQEHTWSAEFADDGRRVTFRKAEAAH